jgi:hypothetical protein
MISRTDAKRLETAVSKIRRKRSEFTLVKGLLYTAFVIFASLALVSLLSLIFYNPVYFSVLKALAIIASAAAAVKFIAFPLKRDKDAGDIVHELEQRSPGLGEDTLNAVLLKKETHKQEFLGTSIHLTDAHIREVTRRLESANPGSLFPKEKLKKLAIPVSGAFLVALLILIFIPGQFRGFLLSPALYPGSSDGVLELADIELTLRYPDYSKRPPETIKGGTGDVKALKGTQVLFRAKPLGKFQGGRLVIENGPSLPVEMNRGRIEAEFTVTGDGGYHITEKNGKEKSVNRTITALEDRTPEISIESPGGDVIEVGGDERIQIFYQAADDFGLGKFKLTVEGDAGKSEKLIANPEDSPKTYGGEITWNLSSLEQVQGGTIKLRVEAYDNDTISGPKAGVSNAITLKLMDAERKHEEVLNLSEQLMEELIDILGDEIEITQKMKESGSPKSSEVNIDLGQITGVQDPLTRKIESAQNTLRTTLGSMTEDGMSDYTNFVGLSNMEIRIGALLGERTELLENFAIVDLPRLGRLMRKEITEFEDDILFLDNMIKGERLRDSLFSGKELMSEYAELQEMLKQLSETGGDDALMEEIQKKLDQISKLMQELAQKMSAMSTEMQEGFLNPDAFQSESMQEMMEKMMNMAKEGNIESALEMLASMMSGLQGMIASLEGGMQSFGSSTMGQDMAKLGELIARIEGIEKEETTLKDNTEKLKDSMLGAPGSSENNLREFVEKQKEKLRELKDNLNQAQSKISRNTPKGMTPEGSYLIDRMLQKSDELKNWLDAMDFKQALRNARNLEESTKGLGQLSDAGVGSLRKASSEITRSHELAEEIRKNLDQFSPEGDGKAPSSGIAERQDEIQNETGELSKEAKELGKQLPISPEISELLGEAEGFMGKASERIREREISKAISNEEEAIQSLQQAKGKAQQMMQQFSMSARGQGMPTPMALGQQQMSGGRQGIDTRYVEIPKADESEVGKDLKERIMEAMKGGSPEGYGELNKKYYDRIIK